eukprot:TRINITY_DN8650_c0_g1_i1.p1 TRINITY_DN8650_c0_g1~~TRINITY_DN8650_c0_g1_i1.p1  ORF type:complete len:238 (+),score=39.66 TRINITY_DN8650_c0_g1_i1:176-889(+)
MFIYRGIRGKELFSTLIESAVTTGVIMAMMYAVMILSRLYIMENLPDQIMGVLTSVSENKFVILFMINIFMIIMGMLMDDVSGILLGTPILVPLVTQIGVDPIHFAAIMGVNLGLGNVTPPTAPLLYLSGRIAGAPVNQMMKPTIYFILFAWIPTLLLTTYVPDISLWLVRLASGNQTTKGHAWNPSGNCTASDWDRPPATPWGRDSQPNVSPKNTRTRQATESRCLKAWPPPAKAT